jgi:hypothetical protein
VLITELKKNRHLSKRSCYYALGKYGELAKPAVPIALADIKVKEYQSAAASFLGNSKLEPAIVVPALIAEIESSKPTYPLTNALGEYGTAAESAIPLLQKLLESDDPDKKEMGKYALEKIEKATE